MLTTGVSGVEQRLQYRFNHGFAVDGQSPEQRPLNQDGLCAQGRALKLSEPQPIPPSWKTSALPPTCSTTSRSFYMAIPLTRKLQVLLIGFNPVVREGLLAIMAKDDALSVMGVYDDAREALLEMRLASNRGQVSDVVLTETRNGQVDGALVTRLIKDEFPTAAVIVLTELDNDSNVIDVIHAGAGGYIFLKEMEPAVLLQSIHRVVEGGTQMKTDLLRRAVDALIQNGRKTLAERTAEAAHLTPREVDVLRLMGNGDANKGIAQSLSISLDTAKKHVQNVISKLDARSRTHAAIIAAQAGIVGSPIASLMPLLEDEEDKPAEDGPA
ncbi:MAG: response regulator transcription factor [Chloroflexi bacterium]|nr:response regulator transcription factor [Chloroflexota bacterium]MDA1271737.1 response regulator transcription factor [Chloroflexota bacterium]